MRDSLDLAGGKGINVTKVLTQCGVEGTATGFVGGYTGRFIENAVTHMGANSQFIEIQKVTRTNLNIVGDDGYITEILEPGPYVTRWESDQLLDLCKKIVPSYDIVAISGSLPEAIAPEYYQKLIHICKESGAKVFLDTSGTALREGIKAKPYCWKPHR